MCVVQDLNRLVIIWPLRIPFPMKSDGLQSYRDELKRQLGGLPDILPDFIGNVDVKLTVLFAIIRADLSDLDTVIGIMVIAKSGEGKTWLLQCFHDSDMFACDIFNRDSLTPASMGTVKAGKKLAIDFAPISCFDEIDKWGMHYFATLLQIFGKEEFTRARGGEKFKVNIRTLPIGTLLWSWKLFETQEGGVRMSQRIHTIEQLLRRCVALYLEPTTEDPAVSEAYIWKVMSDHFENVEYEPLIDMEENQEKLIEVVRRAEELKELGMYVEEDDQVKVNDYIDEIRRQIVISETVSYIETVPHLITVLAEGRALCYGSNTVTLEDYKFVGDILLKHAGKIGFLKEDPKKKIIGKCQNCGQGNLVIRRSMKGRRFIGCDMYPVCHAYYPMPPHGKIVGIGKLCESCKLPIVSITRGELVITTCINPDCQRRAENDEKA